MGNPPTWGHSSSPPPSLPWPWPTLAPTALQSSPPSLQGSHLRRALPHSRASWWVDSAQQQRTWLDARQTFQDSGPPLLNSSGPATGIPLRTGCAPPVVQHLRTLYDLRRLYYGNPDGD